MTPSISRQPDPGTRLGIVPLLVAGMLALTPPLAYGGTLKPTSPQRVTGATPLPLEGNDGWCGSPRSHQGWETQPLVAVNPANSSHLVATWIQDYSDATLVAYSTDAGQHWATVIPLTAECTWNLAKRDPGKFKGYTVGVNDPAVTVGPDGVGYLTSTVSGPNDGYVIAERSVDGGRSWSDPHVLDTAGVQGPEADGTVVDYTNVVADPARPGHAYALWENPGFPVIDRREQYVATTTDGGQNWSEPVRVPTPSFPSFGQLVVLPDGEVLDVFAESPPQLGFASTKLLGPTPPAPSAGIGPTRLYVSRSTDFGSTWSPSELITEADPNNFAAPRVAAAPDGTVYVSWLRRTGPGANTYDLMFTSSSRSPSGGLRWSEPQQAGATVDRPGTGSNGIVSPPNVAVTATGVVGISFYDHRRNPVDNPPEVQVTDYWFRHSHSHDGGLTWTEDFLAGPFNQSSAPDGIVPPQPPLRTDFEGAGSLGDGQGIVRIGNGLGTLFALAEPLPGANFQPASDPRDDGPNPTDLFFMRLKVPSS